MNSCVDETIGVVVSDKRLSEKVLFSTGKRIPSGAWARVGLTVVVMT
ncbi:hypothetical protein SOVF_050080 [Spinacia oleracea]|nr:hypothetical protein SOVF_050080 [Spinacia oleracea]